MSVKEKIAEGKLSVTLAEHLFEKLAPGQDYMIDSKTKKKIVVHVAVARNIQKLETLILVCILFKELKPFFLLTCI